MNTSTPVRLIGRTEFAKLAKVSPPAVTKACESSLQPAVIGKRIDLDHPAAKLYLEKKAYQQGGTDNVDLDPYYSLAVDYFHQTGNKTNRSIQKQFHIGYERARSIVETMKANKVFYFNNKTKKQEKTDPFTGKDLPTLSPKASAMENKKTGFNDDELLFDEPDMSRFLKMPLGELVDRFGTVTRFSDWLAATKRIEDIKAKRLQNAKIEGELINRKLVEIGVIDVFNSAHLRLMSDGAKTISNGVISKHMSGVDIPEIEVYITGVIGSFIKPIKNKIERSLRNA